MTSLFNPVTGGGRGGDVGDSRDRKRGVEGKRGDFGGGRIIKKKKKKAKGVTEKTTIGDALSREEGLVARGNKKSYVINQWSAVRSEHSDRESRVPMLVYVRHSY